MNVLDHGYIKIIRTDYDPYISLQIKMPLFVAQEWFKNEAGFSRIHRPIPPVCYIPKIQIDKSIINRAFEKEVIQSMIEDIHHRSLETYEELLELGVPANAAMTVLPQGIYIEFTEADSVAAYERLVRRHSENPMIQVYLEALASLLKVESPALDADDS